MGDSNALGIGTGVARHAMAHVVVRVGPLTTRAFDRRAVDEHLAAWELANELCERAFPDPHGPFPTREARTARPAHAGTEVSAGTNTEP